MAKKNFELELGGNQLETDDLAASTPSQPQNTILQDEELMNSTSVNEDTTQATAYDTGSVNGITMQEQNDPNRITVTISDEKTPIVVLFGPPQCGKTMTLVRLARFLRARNYNIYPVKTFRPSWDEHYRKMCEDFNDLLTSENAARSTSQISFMLLQVSQGGRPICQILEAPGEHYFVPKDKTANKNFPRYINKIKSNNNRKLWLFFTEPDWQDENDRQNYVERIKRLKNDMKPQDKSIFVFNKIDETPFVMGRGRTNIKEAIKSVKNQYKGIFEPFRNQNPITRFFAEYNCKFVPFSSGYYNNTIDGGVAYEVGPDEYPFHLWNGIVSYIKG